MVYQLIYRSQSRGIPLQKDIDVILEKSIRNNKETGITGLLMYRERFFLQLLEGPRDTVIKCFEKIKEDKRHQNVEIVMQTEAENPAFSKWSMATLSSPQLQTQLHSMTPFLEVAAKYGKVDSGLIVPLLQHFVRGNLFEEIKMQETFG